MYLNTKKGRQSREKENGWVGALAFRQTSLALNSIQRLHHPTLVEFGGVFTPPRPLCMEIILFLGQTMGGRALSANGYD